MQDEASLESLCSVIADCPHSTPEWTDEGVVVLRSPNIRGGRLDLSDASFTTEEHYEERIRRAQPQPGDVVITREAPMGEVCRIPDGLKCCLGQRMVLLRPDPQKVSPLFLLYALQSPQVQWEIRVSEGTGSTVSNLRIPILKKLPIPVLNRAIQDEVGRFLSALDDRIALNHAMNQTLEDIARAVFKSWFIDFDPVHAKAQGEPTRLPPEIDALFPDSFEDDAMQVPTGWETRTFGEFVRVERGLSYKGKHVVEDGKPLMNLGCFGLDATLRRDKMKFYDGEYKDRHVVQPGDLLVANTDMTQDRAILGTPLIVPDGLGETLFTHHIYALRPTDNASDDLMLWIRFALLQPAFRFEAEGRATGTTVLFMPKDAIEDFATAVPPLEILSAFASMLWPMIEKQALNDEQAHSLASMRDLLLPCLLSGELQIPMEVPA